MYTGERSDAVGVLEDFLGEQVDHPQKGWMSMGTKTEVGATREAALVAMSSIATQQSHPLMNWRELEEKVAAAEGSRAEGLAQLNTLQAQRLRSGRRERRCKAQGTGSQPKPSSRSRSWPVLALRK